MEPKGQIGPSRVAYLLGGLLAVVTVGAAALTWYDDGLLGGAMVTRGQARGTAMVALVAGVPALVAALVLAWRGSLRAVIVWLGVAGYLLYNALMLLLATPFNRMFPGYVAMLGLALWSVIVLAASIDVRALAARLDPDAPVRAVAGFLGFVVVANALLWLGGVGRAVTDTLPADFLDGTGMTTNPVWIQDLAFWLPLAGIGAWWCWHRRPWGVLIAPTMLVLWTLEGVGIAADQWFGHRADPASDAASDALVVPFLVLSGLTAIAAIALLRHLRRDAVPPSATS